MQSKKLIKLGNGFLNLDAIVKAVFAENLGKFEAKILLVTGNNVTCEGEEAKALLTYLSHPDNSDDISVDRTAEAGEYQDYKKRGGDMPYEKFLRAYRRHQSLVKKEELTTNQLNLASELEHLLIL